VSWIKNKLRSWLLDDGSDRKARRGISTINSLEEDHEKLSDEPTMRFKIYNARGGKIVEFSRYDRQKDCNFHDLYIIRSDEDFGERIAKIAMLETLKD
jgi:hypothetical protein